MRQNYANTHLLNACYSRIAKELSYNSGPKNYLPSQPNKKSNQLCQMLYKPNYFWWSHNLLRKSLEKADFKEEKNPPLTIYCCGVVILIRDGKPLFHHQILLKVNGGTPCFYSKYFPKSILWKIIDLSTP